MTLAQSWKNHYGTKYIYCFECKSGGNGNKSCQKIGKGGNIKKPCDVGCSVGFLLDNLTYSQAFEPDKAYENTLFD